MRRIKILCFIFIGFCLSFSAFTQSPAIYPIPAFAPFDPVVFAQGNSFTANTHGFPSLFTNPAGFAREDGSFTPLSITGWFLTGNPGGPLATYDLLFNQRILDRAFNDGNDTEAKNTLQNIILSGFGGGCSLGMGYVGNGLGIGLFVTPDLYISGNNLLGTKGEMLLSIVFVGGYALKLNILGINTTLGMDVRPTVLIKSSPTLMELLGIMKGSNNTYIGSLDGLGYAFDFGSMVDLGPFTVGLSVRDILSNYTLFEDNLPNVIDSLTKGMLPDHSNVQPDGTKTYSTPLSVNAGFSFHPNLGSLKNLIDPTVHCEISDVLGTYRDNSLWLRLHLGAEIKTLYSLISLRGGINGGYLTAGLGVDLFFMELNMAIFSLQKGLYVTDDKRAAGFALEIALRF